jgi:hypothetical protein
MTNEWKEVLLGRIAKAAAVPTLDDAAICLSANRVSFKVTNAEPNVIQYWVTEYGIKGRLVF